MGQGKHKGSKTIYHVKIPMDKLHCEGFVPDEILNKQQDRKLFTATFLQTLVARLFSLYVQPYVIITEERTHRTQDDGITRVGTVYTAHLCVGQVPLVQSPNGESVQDIIESKLISIGNN